MRNLPEFKIIIGLKKLGGAWRVQIARLGGGSEGLGGRLLGGGIEEGGYITVKILFILFCFYMLLFLLLI